MVSMSYVNRGFSYFLTIVLGRKKNPDAVAEKRTECSNYY